MPVEELTERLRTADAAAIMKLGRTYPGVRQALSDSGRLDDAYYVERASSTRQRVLRAADVDEASVPYFAITIVPGPKPETRIALTGAASAATSAARNDTAAASDASVSTAAQRNSMGEVVVVGLGPGAAEWVTPRSHGRSKQRPISSATRPT